MINDDSSNDKDGYNTDDSYELVKKEYDSDSSDDTDNVEEDDNCLQKWKEDGDQNEGVTRMLHADRAEQAATRREKN